MGPGASAAAPGAGPGEAAGLEGLLAGRPVDHIRWGLERIEGILEGVGHPERAFRSLHFAGTNGKGSAAATAYAVLEAAGHRAGLYTSPHLVDVRERVRAAGGVPADLLDRSADRVRPLADRTGATYFECVTAVAFLSFAELGVEWASVETGLGGRLDATNALRPAACGILTVSLDHTRHLGESLEEIAREKAGILKPGVRAVLGRVPEAAARVVADRARRVGSPLRRLGRDAAVTEVRTDADGTSFRYASARWPGGILLRTPLPGRHQAENAAVALLALECAGALPGEEALRRGVSRAWLPGRCQLLRRPDGTWLLDIAHNPEGIRALRAALEELPLPGPMAFLAGILVDKPWREMLGGLLRPGERGVLTTAPSSPPERRWDPAAAAGVAIPGLEAEPDFGRALRRVRELAGAGTVVVTGSAYTVGDALARLGGAGATAPPGGSASAAGPGWADGPPTRRGDAGNIERKREEGETDDAVRSPAGPADAG